MPDICRKQVAIGLIIVIHGFWNTVGEISSDLYRASLCDIKKSKVKPFELERNQ